MLCIRVDKELEQKIETFSKEFNITKSKLVKEAIKEYLSKKTPYELGKKYFGKYGSGEKDLSTTYKSKIKEKIYGKNHNR
ncbi:ribbon-helix-helix domain-containing protein [Nitrosophilus labii]|uniref:ribbon-helix-helix domain-containing protein n=1 Tax=Nitrosophilus labii TaxID=2706014 RepID=UPI001656B586|nr:ribbon-helix-helix domain-containing protein [Nitrosophilus labii]